MVTHSRGHMRRRPDARVTIKHGLNKAVMTAAASFVVSSEEACSELPTSGQACASTGASSNEPARHPFKGGGLPG